MEEKRVKKYVSDNAQLMEEWDWEKNEDLLPSQLTLGSHKKAWWKGSCGHKWDAVIKDRNRGYGCPICAGKRVLMGYNDLESQFPELANQWDYKKNDMLLPNSVCAKSSQKVWWICERGHSYDASPCERQRGRGCPYCNRKIVIIGENDLESRNPRLAREYSAKNKEKANSIFVYSHKKVIWKCSLCGNEWNATAHSRMAGNGCPKCAKRAQTSFPEQAIFYYVKKNFPDTINRCTSVLESMEIDIYIPSLKIGIEYDGKHWHNNRTSLKRELKKYELCKDHGITLIRIKENYTTSEIIADYTINVSQNLDYTIGQLREYILISEDINTERDRLSILSEYIQSMKENSFAIKHPNIAKEWNSEKNEGLTPDMFSEFSTQAKFWWRCNKGHEWQATIAHRVGMNSNCPYCSNRKLLKGYNDFLTTNKDQYLFEEWDLKQNDRDGIYQDEIIEGSNKKVWWICKKGHSFDSTISNRKRGHGCPVCSGNLVKEGFNDLATTHPELALEWNYDKNAPLLPSQISKGSNKKVWWICKDGHEWDAQILARSKGSGCPYCKGSKVIFGKNDLCTTHPELIIEWNYSKNNHLSPRECSYGSGKKAWWTCSKCGYEWETRIKLRTKGRGCPFCAKNSKRKE